MDKWISQNKLEVIEREITTAIGVANLEGMLGCAELVVCVDEEAQHYS